MSDNTAAIANELVSLCREGRNMDAIEKFYSPNIISVESGGPPGMSREMTGIAAIKGKNVWWYENNEVHSAETNGPFVSDGNRFAVEYIYDTTFKPTGDRSIMREMALYTVEGDRIIHEHFFYNMPSA
ncbi:MAG: nuclear transport factor 2 family protein [Gemmatimonadaceae bacterium]